MKLVTNSCLALVLCFMATGALMAQSINDGLVAWYPLDGNALDFSEQANHGGVRNNVTPMQDRFEVDGGAMYFSGSESWIDIPGGVDLSGEQMSISVFANVDDLSRGSYQNIVRQDGAGGLPDFMIQFKRRNTLLAFGLHAGGNYWEELLVEVDISQFEGQWRLITATYDGQMMRLYVDAKLIGEQSRTGLVRHTSRWSNIGRMTGREYFKGGIDDVRYYNRALTVADMETIMISQTEAAPEDPIISGTVFNDVNGDCTLDEGEDRLRQRLVHIMPGERYILTKADGTWHTTLPEGDYTARLLPREMWRNHCTYGDVRNFTVKSGDTEVAGLDFAQEPEVLKEELDISLAGLAVRPGFETTYRILYQNTGTMTFSGYINFVHNEWFEFLRADPMADDVDGNHYRWRIEDLPIGHSAVIEIRMRHLPTAPLGEIVCNEAWAERDRQVQLLSAMSDEFCHEVRGSYDPNDISINPGPQIADVYTSLSFLIRFQNTGTAPAAKVIVKQELPQELNINDFLQGVVSHDYEFSIEEGRIATWVFDGIELPDNKADEPASHGYIKYKILLEDETRPGTVVGSNAEIYFDFNEAVITNTAEVELQTAITSVDGSPDESALRVFPNPTSDFATLQIPQGSVAQVSLISVLGHTIQTAQGQPGSSLKFDLRGVSAGQYILRVERDSAVTSLPLTVQR